MATNPEDDARRPGADDALALMDSPLYWTMNVRERLALVQRAHNNRKHEDPGFRERILAWIRTGVLERPEKP